jgi:hypothetical protein
MQLRLQTCPETLRLLKDKGIPVHVKETRAAVDSEPSASLRTRG